LKNKALFLSVSFIVCTLQSCALLDSAAGAGFQSKGDAAMDAQDYKTAATFYSMALDQHKN
jgi:hypothetical protein